MTNVHNSSVSWFSHIDELAEKAAATERYKIGHLKRQAAKLLKEQQEAAAKAAEASAAGNSTGGNSTAGISASKVSNTTAVRRRLARAVLEELADPLGDEPPYATQL